jgi:hypothetical protein
LLETSIRSEADGITFFPLWIQFRSPGDPSTDATGQSDGGTAVENPADESRLDLNGAALRSRTQPCKRVYAEQNPLFLEYLGNFGIRCELDAGSYEIRVSGGPGSLCGFYPCSAAAGKWKLDWAFKIYDLDQGRFINEMKDVTRDDADPVGWYGSFGVAGPQVMLHAGASDPSIETAHPRRAP